MGRDTKTTDRAADQWEQGSLSIPPAPAESDGATAAKVTVPVSGMTCAACTARVQRALEKTEGVQQASVNLMTKNAVISYDSARIAPERLVEVIRETGYEAELASPDQTAFEEQEAQDRAQEQEFKELRLKAIVSLIAAAIGMVISMPVMSAPYAGAHADHGAPRGDPFMNWVHGVIDPWLMGVMPWLY